MTLGNEIKRSVCPVGAVSKTTTEKSMLLTNLEQKEEFRFDDAIGKLHVDFKNDRSIYDQHGSVS